ncbi:prepilin peptidase [Acetobacterium sp.]|uniref:prepilin peptidase n=1 Tax=Acetobacterium sp. TaxID=1872094 RepID=UPI002F41B376
MICLSFILVLFIWIFLGWLLGWCLNLKILPKSWLICIPSILSLLLIEDPTLIIKTGVFMGVLLFVAYYDYQTKTIPRFVHFVLLITGLIGINLSWLINQAIPGMLFLPFPVMAVYFYQKQKDPIKNIGIGDIKLIAACGFVVGINKGVLGLFVGLALALLWCLIKRMNQSTSFPFAPFLCCGFIVSYLLNVLSI